MKDMKDKMKKLLENKKMIGIVGGVIGVVVVIAFVIAITVNGNNNNNNKSANGNTIEAKKTEATETSTKEISTKEEKTTKEKETEVTTTEEATTPKATEKQTEKVTQAPTQAQVVIQPQTQKATQPATQPQTTAQLTEEQQKAQAPVISVAEAKKLEDSGHWAHIAHTSERPIKTPVTRYAYFYDNGIIIGKLTVRGYYYYENGSYTPTFKTCLIDADGDGIEDTYKKYYEYQEEWEIATFGKTSDGTDYGPYYEADRRAFNYFYN